MQEGIIFEIIQVIDLKIVLRFYVSCAGINSRRKINLVHI